jgi:P4 family phage/plasmid primase-like protien
MTTYESEWPVENSKTVYLTELINRETLVEIAKAYKANNPYLTQVLSKETYEPEYEKALKTLFSTTIKALDKSSNELKIKYSQLGGQGRMISRGVRGLQGMKRILRGTVSHMYYDDLDIVNCHPTILLQYCKLNNISSPTLEQYVENRDEIIRAFSDWEITNCKPKNPQIVRNYVKDRIKTSFLAVMNGGKPIIPVNSPIHEDEKAFFQKLTCEMVDVHTRIRKLNKNIKPKSDTDNPLGSICNKLLCQIENRILFHLYNKLILEKFQPDVLCFDGLMVRKSDRDIDTNILSEYILTKTGYKVSFKIKPFEDLLDMNKLREHSIPENIETDIPLSDNAPEKMRIIEKNIFRGENGYTDLYDKLWGRDNIKVVDSKGKRTYIWRENLGIWEEGDINLIKKDILDRLENWVNELKDYYKLENETIIKKAQIQALPKDEVIRLKSIENKAKNLDIVKAKVQAERTASSVVKLLISLCYEKGFAETLDNHKELLPIAENKVINIRTLEITGRKRDHMFTYSLPVRFTGKETPNINKFMLSIASGNEEDRYMTQVYIGYGITRLNTEKVFSVWYGSGDNGKTTVSELISKCMGGKAEPIGHSVIVMHNNKYGNGPNSALSALKKYHLGFINEVEGGTNLDIETIKTIASGGDKISTRDLQETQTTHEVHCKLVLLCNNKPEFKMDKAFIKRLRIIPFLNTFTSEGEEGKRNKAYVNTIRNDHRDEFFSYMVMGAHEFLKLGYLPDSENSLKAKEDMVKHNDDIGEFIDCRCIVDENAKVRTSDLKDAYNTFFSLGDKGKTSKELKCILDGKGFKYVKVKGNVYFKGIRLKDRKEMDGNDTDDE